jgi:hypothetical protein
VRLSRLVAAAALCVALTVPVVSEVAPLAAHATSDYLVASCAPDVIGCLNVAAQVTGSGVDITDFNVLVSTKANPVNVENFVLYWGAVYSGEYPFVLTSYMAWPPSFPGVYSSPVLPKPLADCNIYVGCGYLVEFPVNWSAPECGQLVIHWFIEANNPGESGGSGYVLDSGTDFTFNIGQGDCLPSG